MPLLCSSYWSAADPFQSFLVQQKQTPSSHIVIGNEAGDADSIISAISWAYIKTISRTDDEASLLTPIISITRKDLETQRPETLLLLRLAGISTDSLIYVDDPLITNNDDAMILQVSLVDHNRLTLPLRNYKVVEIVDHHADLGAHPDAPIRMIAFENNVATVASTCTLVAEHWTLPSSFPASLSTLLLGVILLDTVNMLPAAGKGTERDQHAIERLLQHTDWTQLSESAQRTLQLDRSHGRPNSTALFQALQDAKFDPVFWNRLSVYDSLRLDYKRFEASNGAGFGSSSVLISLHDFCAKDDDFQDSMLTFMKERQLDWLVVLFNYMADGSPNRQLMLCTKTDGMASMMDYLMNQEQMQLKSRDVDIPTSSTLCVQTFDQGNPKASRKQVAPILLDYFEKQRQALL